MTRFILLLLSLLLFGPNVLGGTKIVVGSAISMKDAIEQLVAAFSAANPENQVALTLGSTANIVRQIQNGARIDVFVSADLNNISVLTKSGHIASDTANRIAGNEVLLVTPVDAGSGDASTFFESNTAGRIAVCDSSVPIGRYAEEILLAMNTKEKIKTRIVIVENVRAALAMVLKRAVQAAFIYRTDYQLHPDKLRILTFPPAIKNSAEYYAAAVKKGHDPETSGKFLAFLKSETAKKILSKNGFQP